MSDTPQTPLGALVMGGQGQTDAERIGEGIFMVKDISNAYLVTTGDGDLLINTGFLGNGARNKALFAAHRHGPLKRIIVTQAHADHYGALPDQMEDGTQVIVGSGFGETVDYFERLAPFLGRRSGKLWASMTRRDGPPPKPPVIVPDVEVATSLAFAQGGRAFEVVKTPGGESLDSVFVWMPQEKTVFTGNLFGPVWRAMPNLVTMRGDNLRQAACASSPNTFFIHSSRPRPGVLVRGSWIRMSGPSSSLTSAFRLDGGSLNCSPLKTKAK